MGAGLSSMTASIANNLQATFPDVANVCALTQPRKLRVVDGCELLVTEKTCLVRLAIHTAWGPVVVEPQHFAVMPGTDDVVIVGSPTLKRLGIDVYQSVGECARAGHDARVAGADTPSVREVRRVVLSVDAMQHAVQPEVPDETVEHLAERGPEMVMSSAEEEQGRKIRLEATVESTATAGLFSQGASRAQELHFAIPEIDATACVTMLPNAVSGEISVFSEITDCGEEDMMGASTRDENDFTAEGNNNGGAMLGALPNNTVKTDLFVGYREGIT